MEELEVYFSFVGKNISADIINKTNNNMIIPFVEVLKNGSDISIATKCDVFIEAREIKKDVEFYNIPDLLFQKGLKNLDLLIVRCTTTNSKLYDSLPDSYGK